MIGTSNSPHWAYAAHSARKGKRPLMPPTAPGVRTWNEKLTQRLATVARAHRAGGTWRIPPPGRSDEPTRWPRAWREACSALRACCARVAPDPRSTCAVQPHPDNPASLPPLRHQLRHDARKLLLGRMFHVYAWISTPVCPGSNIQPRIREGPPARARRSQSGILAPPWRRWKEGSVGVRLTRHCALRVVIVLQALQKSEMPARNGVGERLAVCHAQCLADLAASFRI
jgi:hypothetical protein